MPPLFFHLGMALAALAFVAKPEVCPDAAGAPPSAKPSEWAQTHLQFMPSPKQAEVLDSDSRYMILCCNRQWGKTTTIAVKALHHALTLAQQTIVIISRTRVQAGILIQRACDFAARLGHPIRRALGHPFSLRLPNGSQIFAVPHTTDTSVGNTANVLIVDEAALVKDTVFFTVAPFVARTRGAIWLMSTPRRPAGFFYNIWRDHNDTRWHRVLSTVQDCPEIDQEFLDMQRRADEIKFRQDFHCEFLQPAGRLFTEELIDSILER